MAGLIPENENQTPLLGLGARSALGGTLMGLANLVPGISGGTMLLAAGIYPRFINAIAEVTTLRFRTASLVVLGSVVASAAVSILMLAGTVKDLIVDHRWATYSLFIGLTLGGVPVIWRLLGSPDRRAWGGAAVGFLVMAALGLAQATGIGTGVGGATSTQMMFLAGVAGASAMILPGVSGGYLLLILGAYVPILGGIDAVKTSLRAGDLQGLSEPLLTVVLPVGVGVVVGVVAVSNLVRLLLSRYEQITLGLLMGLLLGAVIGLWPFQQGVPPQVGHVVKGETMTQAQIDALDPEDWPTAIFTPSPTQVGSSGLLILLGLALTTGVALVGREEDAG